MDGNEAFGILLAEEGETMRTGPIHATSRVVLGAGVGGLLVWLGMRASRWLQSELAYQRWRRARTPHHEILGIGAVMPLNYQHQKSAR